MKKGKKEDTKERDKPDETDTNKLSERYPFFYLEQASP